MTALIHQSMRNLVRIEMLILAAFAGIMAICLHDYLLWASAHFILGILSLPFLVRTEVKAGRSTYILLGSAVLFLALCFLFPVKAFFFFSVGFTILLLVNQYIGRTGFEAIVVLFLCSPLFGAAAEIFSFPIRLQLSSIAGTVLSFFTSDVSVRGNTILYAGREYAVDPACMGLSMLTVSFSLGLLLLGFFGRKAGRSLNWWQVLLFLSLVFLLNMISNLCRIIMLVLFDINPGTAGHEAAGLVCLLVYVFIPTIRLARSGIEKFGTVEKIQSGTNRITPLIFLLLLPVVILAWLNIKSSDTYKQYHTSLHNVNGYALSIFAPGVIKAENPSSLVYIKYLRAFYDSEHHPMLCWAGSGFEFRKVQEEKIKGRMVYTARLIRDNEVLYSAWWYSNGYKNTNSQFQWRFDMARGAAGYAIINVTCSSMENLHKEVERILEQQPFTPLFHHHKTGK
jgi:exosortase N